MPPDQDPQIEYRLRLRLLDGTEKASGSFKTQRARAIGDVVNLPTGPDNRSVAGPGFVWRVRSVEDGGETLILDYERPHEPHEHA